MAGFIKDREKLIVAAGLICITIFTDLFLINSNHSDDSREDRLKDGLTSAPKAAWLEKLVSAAIRKSGEYRYDGEYFTEGHIILDTEEKEGKLTVYTIASVGWFGFENGIFTEISGAGPTPTVIRFTKNNAGEYSLLDYEEPSDGNDYIKSIKRMFPEKLYPRVLSNYDDARVMKMQEQQAGEYLKSIGRKAKVSIEYVEKPFPAIDGEAWNMLFCEYAKHSSFLSNCPNWLGTREQVENGVRYIYRTSLSNTSDGYDLITFRKTKESGALIEERSYKIVDGNPQLVIGDKDLDQ